MVSFGVTATSFQFHKQILYWSLQGKHDIMYILREF